MKTAPKFSPGETVIKNGKTYVIISIILPAVDGTPRYTAREHCPNFRRLPHSVAINEKGMEWVP